MSNTRSTNPGHDFELGAVDDSQKRGFWSMFVIMMGFTFFSASMWVGGESDGPLRIHCARVAAKDAVVSAKIALAK